MTQEQVLQAALALPLENRAELVQALSQTLDPAHLDWEQAWITEAERRNLELENGTVQETPYTDAINRIRKKLK